VEYVLIHKPIGLLPPEVMKLTFENAKKLMANTDAFVPGGKCTSSYMALGEQVIFCNWDVPRIEAFTNLLRQMSIAGWNTEVIPVERADAALPKIEKMMQELQVPAMTG
jgi:hypothetical protein